MLVAEGWLKETYNKNGTHVWRYTGPQNPTHTQMDVIIKRVDEYAHEKNAQREKKGTRIRNRMPELPLTPATVTRSTDVLRKKYVRILWGLIKLEVK